jgi:hypothetical protein
MTPSARLLASAAALLALLSCRGERLPEVTAERTAIVRGNFDFIPEHWKEPRLRELFLGETFREITAPGELDLFLAGCDWTHRQWPKGRPEPYPPCNAVDILREIRAGRTGGFCGQYAYVLADVLKASGFFAVRYVELTREDGEGHFVVEAWSDEHAKWMVLDPAYNLWYRLAGSGAPASALEVREALLGGPAVEPVAARGALDPEAGALAPYYRNVAVSLRSDLMRSGRPLTNQDRLDMFLFFRDARTGKPFGGKVPYRNVTGRREDIAYDCNMARVEVQRAPGRVTLGFRTDGSMPNFKEFRVRTDPAGEWAPSPATMEVTRASGIKTLWVVPVNQFNRSGVTTRVDIEW